MADTKPDAKICDPNKSEYHKEIPPQKIHKDTYKETTTDNSLTSKIQNSASEEPPKLFSYIMNEKQDDSETETSWHTVLEVKVKSDDKSYENSNNEESTMIDLATTNCRKDSTIPLKFDELPPEPDWTTISNVIMKGEKDAYIMSDTKPNTKNYDLNKSECHKEMSPQKIHEEESTKTDLAIANWSKVNTIPLQFDELPPEPDWTTVSNAAVKDAKVDSVSDETYEYKGFPKENVNRRHSYSKNQYSRVPHSAKLSVTRASRDKLRHANLNEGHKFEDLKQEIYRYRDDGDLKYVQHDQYYHCRRNFKPHTSTQVSSTPYRPRDPSPDYD